MSSTATPAARRLPVVKLTVAVLVLGVGGLLAVRHFGVAQLVAWLDQFVALIRDLGPWAFFTAMVLLPAAGAPLSAFNLVAGEAFAPRMTMPGVIAAVIVAIGINLALTYWLARYAFRPLLTRLIGTYGYTVPRLEAKNAITVSLLVRLTPGPPFFFQSYLLGLAEVPFRIYMIVSWLAVLPLALAVVMLGKAAREGNLGRIAAVAGLMVAAVVAVQVVRRRVAQRED
jgi:uncharacterized membrane protein YdjX (TVP38/TMEM64 family)